MNSSFPTPIFIAFKTSYGVVFYSSTLFYILADILADLTSSLVCYVSCKSGKYWILHPKFRAPRSIVPYKNSRGGVLRLKTNNVVLVDLKVLE